MSEAEKTVVLFSIFAAISFLSWRKGREGRFEDNMHYILLSSFAAVWAFIFFIVLTVQM